MKRKSAQLLKSTIERFSCWGTRLINCDFEKERVPAQIAESPLFTNVSLYPFIALDLIKTR